jgi:hypothetical protein
VSQEAEKVATELIELRKARKALAEQEAEKEAELVGLMDGKTLEVPGLGVFEKHAKSSRKAWRHAELQSTLVRKLRNGEVPKKTDPETGEIIDEDDIARTARIFTETANPSWRVTALKALDIDPTEYNETTYTGGYTIEFKGTV